MECKAQEWGGSQGTFAADSVPVNLPGCVLPYIWYLFNGMKEVKWSNVIWKSWPAALIFFFSLSYMKANVPTGGWFGAGVCRVLLELSIWTGTIFTPFYKSHLTFVCLHDDLQERAGYVLLWSVLFHLFEIQSLARTAKCIFLSDRGLGCVNLISDKTEALHWGILI